MNIGNLIDLSDLLGSLIGALLGFGGAYWLLTLESRERKTSHVKEKRVHIEHVITSLGRSIESWSQLRTEYRDYTKLNHERMFEDHAPFYPAVNVDRSIFTFDHHSTYVAFNEVYGSEGKRLYEQLYAAVDPMVEVLVRGQILTADVLHLVRPRSFEAEKLGNELLHVVGALLVKHAGSDAPVFLELSQILDRTVQEMIRRPKELLDVFQKELAGPVANLNVGLDYYLEFRTSQLLANQYTATLKVRQDLLVKIIVQLGSLVRALDECNGSLRELHDELSGTWDRAGDEGYA